MDVVSKLQLLTSPNIMRLNLGKRNVHHRVVSYLEYSNIQHLSYAILFAPDSILTLDDENSSGPSSLESDLGDQDNFRTLESQDQDDIEQGQDLDGNNQVDLDHDGLNQNLDENDVDDEQREGLDDDDACKAIQIDLDQVFKNTFILITNP